MAHSGLKFTQIALTRSQADKKEELTESFTKAYEVTLKKFHSFVVKPIFGVSFFFSLLFHLPTVDLTGLLTSSVSQLAMKACPYRVAFYEKLGSPLEMVEEELTKWLAALATIIAQLEAFYEKGNYAKGL